MYEIYLAGHSFGGRVGARRRADQASALAAKAARDGVTPTVLVSVSEFWTQGRLEAQRRLEGRYWRGQFERMRGAFDPGDVQGSVAAAVVDGVFPDTYKV